MNSREDSPLKGSSRRVVRDLIIDFMEKKGPIAFSPTIIEQGLIQRGYEVQRSAIQHALQRGENSVFLKVQRGYYTLTHFKLKEIADIAGYPDFFSLEREFGVHDIHAYAKNIKGVFKRLKTNINTSWKKEKHNKGYTTKDTFDPYGTFSITIYPKDTIQVTLKNHNTPITQLKDYITFFSMIKVILKEYIPDKDFLNRFKIKQWHLNQDDFTIRYLGDEIIYPVFRGMKLAIYRKENGTRFEQRNSVKNESIPWLGIGRILTHNDGVGILTEAVGKLQIANLGVILSKQYNRIERNVESIIHYADNRINSFEEKFENEMQSVVDIYSDMNNKLEGSLKKRGVKRFGFEKTPNEKVIAMRRFASKIRHEPGDRFAKVAQMFGVSKTTAWRYCHE